VANQAAVAIENARLYADLRKKVRELEELQEALTAEKQLSALGTAIANLQHRISNDISVVGLNVPILRSRVDPADETSVRSLDIIERNAHHVSVIMTRIHKTLQDSEPQDVDVNAVLNEVIAGVKEQQEGSKTSPHIVIRSDLDNSNPHTRAPVGQLTEVFHNLLDNACHAMRDKGGEVSISSCLLDRTVFIRVHDEGPGIPLAIQQRLFKKPAPAKEPGGGTGLGLWLNGLVLQSLGGSARIERTDFTGTTILIQVPALAVTTEEVL
jgi:signal transduction histidine kinase